MRGHNKNVLVIIIFICCFFLISLTNPALSQECKIIGFEKNVDAFYFNGNDFEQPSNLDFKNGGNSMRVLKAEPNHKRVVSSSIVLNRSSGLIGLYWKKNGSNAKYFDLSLYYDDQFIAKCDNNNDWGRKIFYKLENNKNKTHTIKWVLEHGGTDYIGEPFGTPPTADAFIDDLELCDIRFEIDELESSGIVEVQLPQSSNNSMHLFQDTNISIQDAIDLIKDMQNGGNYTIKTLILSPGEYNLNNTLNIIRLKDISIECENYKSGGHSIIHISAETAKINIENCTNVDIRGLDLDGGMYGIYLNNSSKCEIMNNLIKNFYTSGVVLDNSSENIIKSSEIKSYLDSAIGIQLLNSSSNGIEKNDISVYKECYNLKFESRDNNVIDGNPSGLIFVLGKIYEICINNAGFKEYNHRARCNSMVVLDKNNTFTRWGIND
jgi:parallel beta-helix repeat protein